MKVLYSVRVFVGILWYFRVGCTTKRQLDINFIFLLDLFKCYSGCYASYFWLLGNGFSWTPVWVIQKKFYFRFAHYTHSRFFWKKSRKCEHHRTYMYYAPPFLWYLRRLFISSLSLFNCFVFSFHFHPNGE